MQRKQEFICKTLDEGMGLAVSYFHLSEEKIFLNILEENEDGYKVEDIYTIINSVKDNSKKKKSTKGVKVSKKVLNVTPETENTTV